MLVYYVVKLNDADGSKVIIFILINFLIYYTGSAYGFIISILVPKLEVKFILAQYFISKKNI
jgi:hypothetical protein